MARAMWTGVIAFGMVTIPVKLYAATESHSVPFHQLHEKCDTRIKEQRWCPHCEQQVDWDEIVKGYEYAKGQFVELTKEDFDKLPLPSKHTIEVSDFVKMTDIDPIYYDSSYYLEADKAAQKPYKLLLEALIEKEMVGVASIAFRNKERMCALRPMNDSLIVETLLYPDEIRKTPNAKLSAVKVSPQEKKMAGSLIDAMTTAFEPDRFKDKYQSALKKLIAAKLKGVELKEPKPAENEKVFDLMEALKASIEERKTIRKSSSTTKTTTKTKERTASQKKVRVRKKTA